MGLNTSSYCQKKSSNSKLDENCNYCIDNLDKNKNLSVDKLDENSNKSKIEILIIDDSIAILKMSSMIINKCGYNTECELSGEMGIKNIKNKWCEKNNQYNIIILDIIMPDMNGFAVAKKIREMEIEYEMKKHIIIGCTSRNISLNDNFDYEFKKPFPLTKLLEVINKEIIDKSTVNSNL